MKLKKNQEPHRLLLVEDSVSFAYCIKTVLEKEPGLEIVLARDMAEAEKAIDVFGGEFFLALLDLTLPDASGDEIVLLAASRQIPCVVFTGTYADDLRDRMFNLGAIDYVLKDNPHSLTQIVSLVRRIRANRDWTALVVDDSQTARAQTTSLLKKFQFKVIEAEDGHEALSILEKTPDIRLVLTDFNMPKMDGCDLTKAIRLKHSPDKLAIIGMSAGGNAPLSAKFLKFGANDFLKTPYLREELCWRINQNMEHLDSVQARILATTHDPLTQLLNRGAFIDKAEGAAGQLRRGALSGGFVIGMFEVQGLDAIEQEKGFVFADKLLAHIANRIDDVFTKEGDAVGRFSDNRLCVLMQGVDAETAKFAFQEALQKLADAPFEQDGETFAPKVAAALSGLTNKGVLEMIRSTEHLIAESRDEAEGGVAIDPAPEEEAA